MPVIGAVAVPHPPLIMPEVGHGDEKAISKTIEAYRAVMKEAAALRPDVAFIVSPHAHCYQDYFLISQWHFGRGDFGAFRASELQIECDYDEEFVEALGEAFKRSEISGGTGNFIGLSDPLDHGTMIPLRFLQEFLPDIKVVRMGISGYSPLDHYRAGQAIAKVAEAQDKRLLFIASGDLSHGLKAEGPYGFVKEGPVFDAQICGIFKSGNFLKLLTMDEELVEKSMNCGYLPFAVMAGALDSLAVKPQLRSYEGPFGVGYAVASFAVAGEDPSRAFGKAYCKIQQAQAQKKEQTMDPLVKLAKATVDYTCKGLKGDAAWDQAERELEGRIPPELLQKRAGCFVTLHKFGRLRGCIGTILPVQGNLGLEIIHNAVSACTSDPRFDAVSAAELPYLEYSVDVLSDPEKIESESRLDPKIYGVIVTKGSRRGLLLPDLDGVDSVRQQLEIAKRKAGLEPDEEGCALERFTVVRHF